MARHVDAATLKQMITDPDELALLDVREDGEFGEGHMLFAVPMPYSHLEARLGTQLPRRSTRTVLVDSGDGVAERAAARMAAVGYSDVAILRRQLMPGSGGYEILKVSILKAFGEVVERRTLDQRQECMPCSTAGRIWWWWTGARRKFHRMNIPRGMSVPNAS